MARKETIDEYLARGGKVQVLSSSMTSDVPNGHTMKQLSKRGFNARRDTGKNLYDGSRVKEAE